MLGDETGFVAERPPCLTAQPAVCRCRRSTGVRPPQTPGRNPAAAVHSDRTRHSAQTRRAISISSGLSEKKSTSGKSLQQGVGPPVGALVESEELGERPALAGGGQDTVVGAGERHDVHGTAPGVPSTRTVRRGPLPSRIAGCTIALTAPGRQGTCRNGRTRPSHLAPARPLVAMEGSGRARRGDPWRGGDRSRRPTRRRGCRATSLGRSRGSGSGRTRRAPGAARGRQR